MSTHFSHLNERPAAQGDFDYPTQRRKVSAYRPDKIYRIVLDSAHREAGTAIDDAIFNLPLAPWALPTNMDAQPKHWRLQLESFILQSDDEAGTPVLLKVHMDGLQQPDAVTSEGGQSDVVGLAVGNTSHASSDAYLGAVSLPTPPNSRLRLYLSEAGGSSSLRAPSVRAADSAKWVAVLAIVPVII